MNGVTVLTVFQGKRRPPSLPALTQNLGELVLGNAVTVLGPEVIGE